MKFRKREQPPPEESVLSLTARIVSNSSERTQLRRVVDMVNTGHSAEEIKAWALKEILRLMNDLGDELPQVMEKP